MYITACHKSRRAQTDYQIPIQNVTKIGKIILKMFGTLFSEQDSLQKQNIKKFSPALPNKDVYVSALSLLIYIVAAASFFIKQKGHNCNPGNFSDHFPFVRLGWIIICLLEKKNVRMNSTPFVSGLNRLNRKNGPGHHRLFGTGIVC
jgi:hypothetical protein